MRIEAWASAVGAFAVAALGHLGPAAADAGPPAKDAAVAPPRPPLPPEPPTEAPPWEHHLDVGVDLAVVSRPAHLDGSGAPTGARLGVAPGYAIHLSWEIFRFLRFTTYLVGAHHPLSFPAGSLGQMGLVQSDSVNTYVFGARLAPTLPLSPRARLWATVGAGWGRFAYPHMQVTDPGAMASFRTPERDAFLVELPLGIGGSFDLIPRWLSLQIELTGAIPLGQEGSAIDTSQAVDTAGKKRTLGALPRIDASFVQTIGLSILL